MRTEPVTMNEFAEAVRQDLQERLSGMYPELQVNIQQVNKLQGESYLGVKIDSGTGKKPATKKSSPPAIKPAESGDKLFALIGGMIPYEGSMWMGNATELAERLRMTDPSVSLAPMQLSRKLNLMKEKLEAEGIFYESGRNSSGRYLTLTRKPVENRSRKETNGKKETAKTETAEKPKKKTVRKARKKTAGTDIKEKPNAS